MRLALFCFLFLSQAVIAAALLDFFKNILKQSKWNGFRVTWGLNPFSSTTFAHLPRTTADARDQGWFKHGECNENPAWRGERWVKGDDSVILLFDVNGYIAGIQTGLPKTDPNGFPFDSIKPPFYELSDSYVISAYFVHPDSICTTGRTAEEFEEQGTGSGLYLMGRDGVPVLIPREEKNIETTLWTKGKCFYSMGQHYWYNITADMSCNDFYPAFLMYNRGLLTGFGWAFGGDFNSPRFEHPPPRSYGKFFDTIPNCLHDLGRLTTLHIYLTDSIIRLLC